MINPFPSLQYPKSKLTILVLLTLNAVIYALVDTPTSAIDAISWLILLIIYEIEANASELPVSEAALRAVRYGLIALIVWVFFNYLLEGEILDLINTLLWLGLIVMLELEVRWPDYVMQRKNRIWQVTMVCFVGLIVMAGIWLWQGAWLDAYDAVLWIAAFGLIEVDIFRFLQGKQSQH
jgi:hypothetical protein